VTRPDILVDLDKKYTGGKIVRAATTVYKQYIEPLLPHSVPALYGALVGTCMYLFHSYGYPQINDSLQRHIAIPLTYALPFVTLMMAMWSDPGIITKTNHQFALSMFAYDDIIFHSGNECRTCKFEKPARSKHCSNCGGCISMCDHHCIWINNCVGYNNYRWFLLFVIANVILLCYGFYLTGSLLSIVVARVQKDVPASFLNYKAWARALYHTKESKITGCLMLLCGSLSTVAIAFLLVHIRYLYQGVTTNETQKWEEIGDCIEDGTLFYYQYPVEVVAKRAGQANEPSIVLQRLPNGTFHRALTPKERIKVEQNGMVLRQVKGFQDINNIYDRGLVNNIFCVLFPQLHKGY
jgi:palmitoyltransferase ZDHHC4